MEMNLQARNKSNAVSYSEVYFCNDPKRLTILNRKNLSPEKLEFIRRLREIKPAKSVKLLFYMALWGLASFFAMTVDYFPIQVLSCFAISWSLMGFSIFMHEASHGLIFKKAWLNRWIGFLCGLPVLVAISAYRANHILHHAHERSERDPDDIEAAAGKSMPLVLMYYLEHHLFPGIPWYNLPKIHALLQEEYRRAGSSVYRSYTEFLVDFFKTTWGGVVPNVRLIPSHLRKEVCA